MLDISIESLEKATKSATSAAEFIKKRLKVVEKIDGTKLTLIRNSVEFDPKDYTKNWIVSYKGNVIYPGEIDGLTGRDDEIRRESLGVSQYKFVFDHLRKVHAETAEIPLDTEFFVEFVQHKPTITRDYSERHGMFLVGFGPTEYVESRGQLYASSSFVKDPSRLELYRTILQLRSFPTLFDGSLSSIESIFSDAAFIDPLLRSSFKKVFCNVDFSDAHAVIAAAAAGFRNMESHLGGPSEGVVISTHGPHQRLYKVLAMDQHDKIVRDQKKRRFKGTDDQEKAYWEEINALVDEILDDVLSVSVASQNEMMRRLSDKAYSLSSGEFLAYHPVKTLLNRQEDVMLTAKTRIFVLGHRHKSIAVIPMAAKPFHSGHEALLDAAVADGNELVIVYLSTSGRDEISSSEMVSIWRDNYLPKIQERYGDRVLIRFMVGSSPMYELRMSVTNMVRQSPMTKVRLYGDPHDAFMRVDDIISNEKNSIPLGGRVEVRSVDRAATQGVSGTEMRSYLARGRKREFIMRLPRFLTVEDRESIWLHLTNKARKTDA